MWMYMKFVSVREENAMDSCTEVDDSLRQTLKGKS